MYETILHRHRAVWEKKQVLRAIYSEWYQKIVGALSTGNTVEIGGGSGNLKEYFPEMITSDIVLLPWVNLVLDAHNVPFKDESLENVVLFDVLHHLENPSSFLDELVRVLRPGGRAVLMEPYVSLASYPVYRFFHSEALDMSQDPFEAEKASPVRNPFSANQAIPTLIFNRYKDSFQKRYPALKLIRCDRLGFLAYPLSGGFDHPSLLPLWAIKPAFLIERFLSFFGSLLAFRIFVVLEKVAT